MAEVEEVLVRVTVETGFKTAALLPVPLKDGTRPCYYRQINGTITGMDRLHRTSLVPPRPEPLG